MKFIYVIGSLILLFFVSTPIYRLITIDKGLEDKIKNGAILLDVRTVNEYTKGHADGSVNISLGMIPERYTELDPNETYITYCSHGLRSVKAKNLLKNKGFNNVYNGGTLSKVKKILKKVFPKQ